MEQFIQNILIGVRQWVGEKLDDITFVVASHINELTERVDVLENEGGEANVIETVKVNGTALTPDENKGVDIQIPVTGVDSSDKVLTVNGTTVKSQISLTHDSTNHLIKLLGKGESGSEQVISTVDTTDFIKDGMLDSAGLYVRTNGTWSTALPTLPAGTTEPFTDGTYILLIWNTDANKTALFINVSSLVDTYAAGTGLTLAGNVFSLNAASSSAIGGIKLGYAQNGKNYPIALDDDNKAYVNVPFEVIPKVKNQLIYSDDGSTLTTHQLMFVDGLVVDTAEDLDKCKNQSDFSMEEVAKTWTRHIMNYKDPLWGTQPATFDSLGTVDKPSDNSTSAINAWHYVNKDGIDTRLYNEQTTTATYQYTLSNGEVQDYIYNYNNPAISTFLASEKKYGSYYSKMSVGINPAKNLQGYTDRVATIPAQIIKNGYLYQIEVYTNNYSDTEGWIGNGNMTVGIAVRKVEYPLKNTAIDKSSSAELILTAAEGLTIVPFDGALNNQNVGSESAIVLETIYRGSQLTIGFSLPYRNDGNTHDDKVPVLTDRRVTIDFESYTLSYKDKDGTSHTKNLTSSIVHDVFDAIRGQEVNRAFMQDSSPGCMWRNIVNLDGSTVLDIRTEENKVYVFNGETWEVASSTTPLEMFKNGSRFAWNNITNKLFYCDGINIYSVSSGGSGGSYTLPAATSDSLGGIKVASAETSGLTLDAEGNLSIAAPEVLDIVNFLNQDEEQQL